jgi:hypothetical protein
MEAITAQPSLFDAKFIERGAYRWNSPDTSIEAAHRVDVAGLLKDCLEAIAQSANGLTNDEIAIATRHPLNSISPRSAQLKRKGLIKDSGKRRPTRTGSKAIVWQITSLGREAL